MKAIFDQHYQNPTFKFTFEREGHATLLVAVENEGAADTSLSGYTARLYYYKSVQDDSSYQINSASLDDSTGIFTFNVAPEDLGPAGAYRAALSILDGSGNVFITSLGNVIIRRSILENGTTAATTGPTLNFAVFNAYQNVEDSGPYRPGTNVSFTVLGDGSVQINSAGGGGSGDVTAAANISDNRMVKGDGGSKGIQETGITVTDLDVMTGVTSVIADDTLTARQTLKLGPDIDDLTRCDIDATYARLISALECNSNALNDVSSITMAGAGTVDGRDLSADGTKLDGIESGATADQTGAEIKTAYEAEADTNAFTDSEQTKLAGIESAADVTDTANVSAALPATTKGDLLVYNGSAYVRLGVGTNDQVVKADSNEAAGVKWANESGGGGSTPAYFKDIEGTRFSANGGPLGAGASPAPHSEAGTNINLSGAAFDDSQTETAGPFRIRVPDNVDNTTDVKFHIRGFAGDTNNLVFRVQYATNGDNALTNEDLTFAGATSKTAIAENTISVDMTLTAGDELIFFLARLGGDAADTSVGDFVVTLLTVEIARS